MMANIKVDYVVKDDNGNEVIINHAEEVTEKQKEKYAAYAAKLKKASNK
jgi:hypothetical protein